MKYFLFTCLVIGVLNSSVMAAERCEIITDRVSCPGREVKAFKSYITETNPTGNPTVDKVAADTKEKCLEAGLMSSPIIRARTLATKKVKVKFDGVEVGAFSDQRKCSDLKKSDENSSKDLK